MISSEVIIRTLISFRTYKYGKSRLQYNMLCSIHFPSLKYTHTLENVQYPLSHCTSIFFEKVNIFKKVVYRHVCPCMFDKRNYDSVSLGLFKNGLLLDFP
jgi:hypothetical protein